MTIMALIIFVRREYPVLLKHAHDFFISRSSTSPCTSWDYGPDPSARFTISPTVERIYSRGKWNELLRS